jgi:hypothetical protein
MYPYINRKVFKANMYIEPVEGWENPIMPTINEKESRDA